MPCSNPVSSRTPGPLGGLHCRTVPGAGRKLRPASSALIRNSKEWPRSSGSSYPMRLAVGDPELLAYEVDAGDLLGHRVLDLQPGVDLEEGDGAVLADQELAGARADVPGLFEDGLGARVERSHLLVGQEGRRGLLDELLVAALERAVTGGDDDDVAVVVGEALGLDVPRPVEVALDEALAAPERPDRLAYGGVVQLGDLLHRTGDLQPAPAAAERGLDRDRQAVLSRERDDLVGVLDGSVVPATSGAPTFWAMWRACTLSPSAVDRGRRRARSRSARRR